MKTKICTRCKKTKPFTEFYKNPREKNGLDYWCKECFKEYYKNYKERYKKSHKEYNKSHKEKIRKYHEEYRGKNPIKIKKRKKEYYQNNNERIKKNLRERRKDISVKLNNNIANSIRSSLKSNKNGGHWESIIGYTLIDLKKHLEKQFKEGMTWQNYGRNGWHIDHRIPISIFNIKGIKSKGFKQCWALENLQPLWEFDNISKHNKLFV